MPAGPDNTWGRVLAKHFEMVLSSISDLASSLQNSGLKLRRALILFFKFLSVLHVWGLRRLRGKYLIRLLRSKWTTEPQTWHRKKKVYNFPQSTKSFSYITMSFPGNTNSFPQKKYFHTNYLYNRSAKRQISQSTKIQWITLEWGWATKRFKKA